MSHRAFQSSDAMPFHIEWNGESVTVNSGGTATAAMAVVDLDTPITDDDRGRGVSARGTLLFGDTVYIRLDGNVVVRGEKWQVDRSRKAEDGGRLWYIEKTEKQFTTARSGGYVPGR
jgi:hypothetical protein